MMGIIISVWNNEKRSPQYITRPEARAKKHKGVTERRLETLVYVTPKPLTDTDALAMSMIQCQLHHRLHQTRDKYTDRMRKTTFLQTYIHTYVRTHILLRLHDAHTLFQALTRHSQDRLGHILPCPHQKFPIVKSIHLYKQSDTLQHWYSTTH